MQVYELMIAHWVSPGSPVSILLSFLNMATIAGITGKQFVKGTQAWDNNK